MPGARCTTNSAASCSERHRSTDVYRTQRTRLPRFGPGRTGRTPAGDDAVGQLDVECGQESVKVGDYDDFPRPDVCDHAGIGHFLLASNGSATACRRRWSFASGAPGNEDEFTRGPVGSVADLIGDQTGRDEPRTDHRAGRPPQRPSMAAATGSEIMSPHPLNSGAATGSASRSRSRALSQPSHLWNSITRPAGRVRSR